MGDEDTSMREDMEAAIAALEDDTEESEAGSDQAAEGDPPAETPPAEAESKPPADEKKGQVQDVEKPPADLGEKANKEAPKDKVNPPAGWPPAAREKFAALPDDIQSLIAKRELEINQGLNDGAQDRKLGQTFNQVMQPYQSLIASEGGKDPIQAVQALMNTAAELKMGSPQQKATRMAAMIKHYGIDIGMLDSAIVGESPASPEAAQLEQLLDQKLQPVNQFMNQVGTMQQQSQQEMQNNATNEVQQFEQQAEFIGDVRNDMADLLDMAAKQGREMTLQEAYDKACAMNPEISSVLEQRKKEEQIKNANQNLSQKKAAASSISGNQVGDGSGQTADSLRGSLLEAWDDQAGR